MGKRKVIGEIVRAVVPTLCLLGTAIYTHFTTVTMTDDAHVRSISFLCLLSVTAMLFLASFVINAIRPAKPSTWILSIIQIVFSGLAVAGVMHYEAHVKEITLPDLLCSTFSVMFFVVEAYQLARLFTTASDALDNYVDDLHSHSSDSDACENSLRTMLLLACLGCCAGASLFFAETFHRVQSDTSSNHTAIAFIGGCAVLLCLLFIASVLFLPRGSVPVACITAFFIAVQLAMLVDLQSDQNLNIVEVNKKEGLSGAVNSILDKIFNTPPPEPEEKKPKVMIEMHASVVISGIFALVSAVLCSIKKLPAEEEEEQPASWEQKPVDLDDPTMWERLSHAMRCARPCLAGLWPCLIAMLCVPSCHPGWVLLQAGIMGGFHILHITRYEVHVFPHED